MRRGTTPTNTFTTGIDLQGCTIFVSYEQDGRIVFEKTGADLTVTATTVSLTLSQAETLMLHPGRVNIQIRYIDAFGVADASNIISTTAERIIKDGEIQYV